MLINENNIYIYTNLMQFTFLQIDKKYTLLSWLKKNIYINWIIFRFATNAGTEIAKIYENMRFYYN